MLGSSERSCGPSWGAWGGLRGPRGTSFGGLGAFLRVSEVSGEVLGGFWEDPGGMLDLFKVQEKQRQADVEKCIHKT